MTDEGRWPIIRSLTDLVAFKARPEITFCNEFLQCAVSLWGCRELVGKLIRQIHMHVHRNERWEVMSFDEAQLAANMSRLVIALWSDPEPLGDHGCLIVPGTMYASKSWGTNVPLCANVGRNNFYGKGLSFAFTKDKKPTLYAWKEPR